MSYYLYFIIYLNKSPPPPSHLKYLTLPNIDLFFLVFFPYTRKSHSSVCYASPVMSSCSLQSCSTTCFSCSGRTSLYVELRWHPGHTTQHNTPHHTALSWLTKLPIVTRGRRWLLLLLLQPNQFWGSLCLPNHQQLAVCRVWTTSTLWKEQSDGALGISSWNVL